VGGIGGTASSEGILITSKRKYNDGFGRRRKINRNGSNSREMTIRRPIKKTKSAKAEKDGRGSREKSSVARREKVKKHHHLQRE